MLDELGNRNGSSESAHDMNMVNPATRPFGKATDFLNMMAEHSKHFVAKIGVLKECLAVFGAEDDVQPDLRQ